MYGSANRSGAINNAKSAKIEIEMGFGEWEGARNCIGHFGFVGLSNYGLIKSDALCAVRPHYN